MTTSTPSAINCAITCWALGLTASWIEIYAKTSCSLAKKLITLPLARCCCNWAWTDSFKFKPNWSSSFWLPTYSIWSLIWPLTPKPVTSSKSLTLSSSVAATNFVKVCAIGWVEYCSIEAIHCSAWACVTWSDNNWISFRLGLPSVNVPVLSITKVLTLLNASIASASLNSTPFCAARPVVAITDMGVAKPKAQGQAIISTATAHISAKSNCAFPKTIQAINVSTLMTSTVTTKYLANTSASRCNGALERWASATVWIIFAKVVFAPTAVVWIRILPCWFTVPPITESFNSFFTGIGSPVIIASST